MHPGACETLHGIKALLSGQVFCLQYHGHHLINELDLTCFACSFCLFVCFSFTSAMQSLVYDV